MHEMSLSELDLMQLLGLEFCLFVCWYRRINSAHCWADLVMTDNVVEWLKLEYGVYDV